MEDCRNRCLLKARRISRNGRTGPDAAGLQARVSVRFISSERAIFVFFDPLSSNYLFVTNIELIENTRSRQDERERKRFP